MQNDGSYLHCLLSGKSFFKKTSEKRKIWIISRCNEVKKNGKSTILQNILEHMSNIDKDKISSLRFIHCMMKNSYHKFIIHDINKEFWKIFQIC